MNLTWLSVIVLAAFAAGWFARGLWERLRILRDYWKNGSPIG